MDCIYRQGGDTDIHMLCTPIIVRSQNLDQIFLLLHCINLMTVDFFLWLWPIWPRTSKKCSGLTVDHEKYFKLTSTDKNQSVQHVSSTLLIGGGQGRERGWVGSRKRLYLSHPLGLKEQCYPSSMWHGQMQSIW